MKHTEVPHELDNREIYQLEHGDKIIYAAVRKYMSKETRECFPAIRTIANMLQCTPGKVQAALKRLVSAKFIEKIPAKEKRNSNHYKFPRTEFDKQFEMFTDEFLELDLPLNVKEYYMDIQQYLYGKDTGVGKCSFSNAELARRTGWTVASVKKYNTILIEKNLLEEHTTNKTDSAGFPIIQKEFDLQGLNQAALWAKKMTETVIKHDDEISELKERVRLLEKQIAIQNNKTIDVNYEF